MSETVINDAVLNHLVKTLDSIRDLLLSAQKHNTAEPAEAEPIKAEPTKEEATRPTPNIDDVRKYMSIVLTDDTVEGKTLIAEVLKSFNAEKLSAINAKDFVSVLVATGEKYEAALRTKDPQNADAKIKPIRDYLGSDIWDSIPF